MIEIDSKLHHIFRLKKSIQKLIDNNFVTLDRLIDIKHPLTNEQILLWWFDPKLLSNSLKKINDFLNGINHENIDSSIATIDIVCVELSKKNGHSKIINGFKTIKEKLVSIK